MLPEASAIEAKMKELASTLLEADVDAAEIRAELRQLIVEAEGHMKQSRIARAAGLTRQRVHQILQEERTK